ncbi:MAG: ATP-binding protein [Marmoricola sp.]
MGALSVRVLGELAVDGLDLRTVVDRKARLLLRCLAMASGRPVTTVALIEALWQDSPPARPADQVSVLASRLRRALGRDAIELGDHGYRLNYDWLDLDELGAVVAAVEDRLAEGSTTSALAAAHVAVALLRGPLPEPVTEVDWVLADHAAAVRLVRRARRGAAAAMLAAGDWFDALDLAEVSAAEDPYDEEAVRLIMRAQTYGGRPAAALAAYASLRALLAEELGTEPAVATAELHTAILRDELAPPEQVSAVRPAATRLVGRTSQLSHLDAMADRLGQGAVRVAVVSGEAGIGKTTLLTTWIEARRQRGDTVLFGTCGQLDRSTPLDVLLAALGEHLRRSPERARLLGDDAALLTPLLGLGPGTSDVGSDPVLGPASLYAALTSVLGRIADPAGAILVFDDAHLAGPALAEWTSFVARRTLPVLVVAAVRPNEGGTFVTTDTVNLGPLDRAATAQLVGEDRADALFERSGGHPLFLSELATSSDDLPASLVTAVERRCEALGAGADLLRGAAVLGSDLDVELLAAVFGRPALDVLDDLELATTRNLLTESSGRYAFRHALVRQALAAGTRPGRTALLHREASKVLAARPDADPVAAAEHARLGGDLPQAARSLRGAAARAAERFDHATAEELLDQSLALEDDDETLLARARVRIRRGRYAEAEADVTATRVPSPAGYEVGAWAAYFDRRFDDATRYAHDGELTAIDPALRARCLIVGGRTLHARGDLRGAERLLAEAASSAEGADRLNASAWLGVLHAHRGRTDQAIELLRPATRSGIGADHTSATLHALLFTGHALAAAGRPAEALASFARYTDEVERRQVPRFSGRGVNFGAWVLRNIGAVDEAREGHLAALDQADSDGTPEVRVAALQDLAEDKLLAGDLDGARALLDEADQSLSGDLVFGWRLAMKLDLLRCRLSLASGDAGSAAAGAGALVRAATDAGVPRYSSVARLIEHQAQVALGETVDLASARRDLAEVEATMAVEAWRWAGETGAGLGQKAWIDRAETLVADLASASGERRDELLREADRRLGEWRLRLR